MKNIVKVKTIFMEKILTHYFKIKEIKKLFVSKTKYNFMSRKNYYRVIIMIMNTIIN